MYILLDEQNIKKGDLIFNKNHREYQYYIDWCHQGNVPEVNNPEIYEALQGLYKGRVFYVCRKSLSGKEKSRINSKSNRLVKIKQIKENFLEKMEASIKAQLLSEGLTEQQADDKISTVALFKKVKDKDFDGIKEDVKTAKPDKDVSQEAIDKLKELSDKSDKDLDRYSINF